MKTSCSSLSLKMGFATSPPPHLRTEGNDLVDTSCIPVFRHHDAIVLSSVHGWNIVDLEIIYSIRVHATIFQFGIVIARNDIGRSVRSMNFKCMTMSAYKVSFDGIGNPPRCALLQS